ncbi:uncharacterized protein [Paramormyrops kingsleyae]|uniref:uncharacterized protein isoform X1 n=1 Tax=Paramormyrops kingsleyae TaxID=1676925 RepID=UPI003B96F197
MECQQGPTPVAEATTAAVQNILAILNQSLGKDSTGSSQGPSSGKDLSMDQEMARSFPGFFRRGAKRSSLSLNKAAKVAKHWNPFNFSVFLLHKNCETKPSPVQELQHMQAGLGKRALAMPEDMTHTQVSNLFKNTYPKMMTITGGWLLYKSAGGHGRRNLSVVPPESEGYTGSTIRSASGAGKTMLYIAPLQEEFDLEPLPDNSQEFSHMPKAECKNCFKILPLQILALHVKQCNASKSDKPSDSEPEVTEVVLSCEKNTKEGKCPICQKNYPAMELELHASVCGDWASEEDVLRWLATRVDKSKEFCICVSRMNLLERGLMLWQRQKNSSPVNLLKVTFIGEAGIDTGALRKEFDRDGCWLRNSAFRGRGWQGKNAQILFK